MLPLPIDSVLPELLARLTEHSSVILSAEPGAGKTTRVPVALLDAGWLSGKKIIMLEPRRLAAQRAAHFMAAQRGEQTGATIGYRIRGDARVSASTKIEIVTEGILTRMVQHDPEMSGVGILVFDEFHERSIHADLGLALALDVQQHLRQDLRILIMSATLDGMAISDLLTGAPIVQSSGRAFPVVTRFLPHQHNRAIEPFVRSAIERAVREEEGDVLVFLPGQREIRKVELLLMDNGMPPNVVVHSLFGEASPAHQQAALKPSPPGTRKVILSTSIAETSMTIDGVRVVIDAGLSRNSRFDPRRGMSGLVTIPVSQASADQRRGRAGRQQPGVCYRLWTEEQQATLPRFSQPEILVADLAPLALEFARWGTPDGSGLRFLDPPPAAHLTQARNLLKELGALDTTGKLTVHGKAMSELPVHPRLSHMLIKGRELGFGALACNIAALLEVRNALRGGRDSDIDLRTQLHALRTNSAVDRLGLERIVAQAGRLRKMLGVKSEGASDENAGVLLALAYPERVAKRKGERFQLASGPMAVLPAGSLLQREMFLAVGDVDGVGTDVKIFLAAPLDEVDMKNIFCDQITMLDEVRWDDGNQSVISRRVTQLGSIELSESSSPADEEKVRLAMIDGIRHMGLPCLPWNREASSLRARSEWLRRQGIAQSVWPDLSNHSLRETMEEWLGPFLGGVTRRTHLARLDLICILSARFTYNQLTELNRLAPTHVMVPTGSRIALDYDSGDLPVLAVRLQEMFGEKESPTIAGGKVRILLHLLSPARRPLAVTQDLVSFWRNAYADVRKEMRGRYPKHHWPENPLDATPTKRTKHFVPPS